MLFNSLTFIVFFAVVLLIHHLPLRWPLKKFNLLIASYLFYAAWNPPFVLLLVVSTLTDWVIGRRLDQTSSQRARRWLLVASLAVNLGLLGYFKYGEFLLEHFTGAMLALGFDYAPPEWDIVLPVGISFYTFQTLSYTLDIYFRKLRPWHSFLDYALFVTFFPQLVAGPIVRASEFLPQCMEPPRFNAKRLGWGLYLMTIGLFQKIVIADGFLAPVVEQVYNGYDPSMLGAWVGTAAFAGQIYCDFAGYSLCAIGAALCLGFSIPDNFRFPYAAVGFSDFWRRWHISLSTWLRDYLYIPLGGSRRSDRRTSINILLTMLIGGLWHGAAWTFVFWGGLHGLYLVGERVLRASPLSRQPFWRTGIGRFALGLMTFALVCFTWVFFRADSFEQAFQVAAAMFGRRPLLLGPPLNWMDLTMGGVPVVILLTIHWTLRDTSLEAAAERLPIWVWSLVTGIMLAAIVMIQPEERAFIYFQF